MPKIFYKEWNATKASLNMVDQAESIIDEYSANGFTLTLRQLYYQFVARDIIENSERSYKNLGNLITKARMAGMIDWDAIEDRNRTHNTYLVEEDDYSVMSDLASQIQFDQWERQDTYVEVWVEKEALGNVIKRACNPWMVPYMSCKGYLSASEAWRAGRRFENKLDQGKNCVLIHLGDHDPSGIDMTRDNRERIDLFSRWEGDVDVRRIALNMDQIEEFNPPPNPTKLTDSRAKEYLRQHGRTSWELDALEPQVMVDMIQSEFKSLIDYEIWNEVRDEEVQVQELLHTAGVKWDAIKSLIEQGDI